MYQKTTHAITVTVEPTFLADQSLPEDRHYVWSYAVQIDNHSEQTIQVLGRYWRITDAFGRVQEVSGTGVVGEQPIISPGQQFRYTSGTPLTTPSGIMEGSYRVTTPRGERFEIAIPAFSLDSPYQQRCLN